MELKLKPSRAPELDDHYNTHGRGTNQLCSNNVVLIYLFRRKLATACNSGGKDWPRHATTIRGWIILDSLPIDQITMIS